MLWVGVKLKLEGSRQTLRRRRLTHFPLLHSSAGRENLLPFRLLNWPFVLQWLEEILKHFKARQNLNMGI